MPRHAPHLGLREPTKAQSRRDYTGAILSVIPGRPLRGPFDARGRGASQGPWPSPALPPSFSLAPARRASLAPAEHNLGSTSSSRFPQSPRDGGRQVIQRYRCPRAGEAATAILVAIVLRPGPRATPRCHLASPESDSQRGDFFNCMSNNPVLEVLALFQLSSSPSSGTAAPVMAAFVVLASKFCAVRVSAFAFSHAKTRSSFFRAASRRRVNFARLTTWSSNLASQFLAAASLLGPSSLSAAVIASLSAMEAAS